MGILPRPDTWLTPSPPPPTSPPTRVEAEVPSVLQTGPDHHTAHLRHFLPSYTVTDCHSGFFQALVGSWAVYYALPVLLLVWSRGRHLTEKQPVIKAYLTISKRK